MSGGVMVLIALIAIGLAALLGYYVRDSIAERERYNSRSA